MLYLKNAFLHAFYKKDPKLQTFCKTPKNENKSYFTSNISRYLSISNRKKVTAWPNEEGGFFELTMYFVKQM